MARSKKNSAAKDASTGDPPSPDNTSDSRADSPRFRAFGSVDRPVLEQVRYCNINQRFEAGYRNVATSLPGHLLQLTIEGAATHEISGRFYRIEPGSFVWYHEDEVVNVEVLEAPWRFYSMNFIATSLTPPPFEERVRTVGSNVADRFQAVVDAWRDVDALKPVRELRVQAAVLLLLAEVWTIPGVSFTTDPSAQLWWELETQVRDNLAQPWDMQRLAAISNRSAATINRACHLAVACPPIKRIKSIRMSLARGLVMRSDLNMSEIANRVGYPRVHEFSRDYRKHFNTTPTDERSRYRAQLND